MTIKLSPYKAIKWCLAIIIILGGTMGISHFIDPSSNVVISQQNTVNRLPGEVFIRKHLMNPDGTIKTTMISRPADDPNRAQGVESLSESLGLWMLYAVEKNDQQLFKESADVAKRSFRMSNDLFYWKVGAGTKAVSTNALVDDLRIMQALYQAARKWNLPEYQDWADDIASSLLENHRVERGLGDFYDEQSKWTSPQLTISYLDSKALGYMYEQNILDDESYQFLTGFMKNLPVQHGFFPFSYDWKQKTYTFQEKINLIDQLFIVYARAQLGESSPAFWQFVKETFYQERKLYGIYEQKTKRAVVGYESPAVYGLAILAAIELQEHDFASDLYYRMIHLQTLHPDNDLYGGFIDYHTRDTHSFDNLIPLLAERKLYNEGILH
ncbi:MAG TPA: glycosyl hydrolase family 8 [Candidatus Bathyarchaeia archaeon]|nr:glycosyl hydrolase family 8 [Candidatus Bathyarchaeia archaeon]